MQHPVPTLRAILSVKKIVGEKRAKRSSPSALLARARVRDSLVSHMMANLKKGWSEPTVGPTVLHLYPQSSGCDPSGVDAHLVLGIVPPFAARHSVMRKSSAGDTRRGEHEDLFIEDTKSCSAALFMA